MNIAPAICAFDNENPVLVEPHSGPLRRAEWAGDGRCLVLSD
jgi:hypothetical protein